MAVFKVKTKNKVDIDKKPRVYVTCHPEDFEKYFKKVCDDIFKTHDCAIYYTEDMTEVIAEDEKAVDLGRNNLFVVPVTFKLLATPNRAMDEDIPYALTEHIPVLPIMMESGIDEFYSKPDKFGELQYLNPYSADLTEISYEEKLKKYLESVLISDELAKRVRAAFDAYIFLSYRKKDRKYANELMRLIHSIPECRDIAIWFDEFLTPGESFKENIEKILDDCKLFTLLVTPQIIEKVVDKNGEVRDNYVISTEIPLAQKKKEEKEKNGKCEGDIVPVIADVINEAVEKELKEKNIPEFIDARSVDLFKKLFLEVIIRNGIRKSDDSPEHNFLIGLAYLEGIDVEVDHERAVTLITSAAEAGVIEAIKKLVTVYKNGIGVKCDYQKVIFWQHKLVSFFESNEFKKIDKFLEFMDALWDLGDYYHETGKSVKALETFTKMLDIGKSQCKDTLCSRIIACLGLCSKQRQKICRYISIAYEKCGNMYERLEDVASALKYYRDALRLKKINYNPNNLNSIEDMLNCYKRLGIVQKQLGNIDKALRCFFKCLEYGNAICKLNGSKTNLPFIYNQIGMVYAVDGDELHAIEFFNKAVEVASEILSNDKEDFYVLSCAVDSYNLIGIKQDNIVEARKYHFKALNGLEMYLKNFERPSALWQKAATLSFISRTFLQVRDFTNAEEYALSALQIRKKLYDTFVNDRSITELASSYMDLGYISKKQNDFEQAAQFYEEAYALLLDINNISISTEKNIANLLYFMAVVDNNLPNKTKLKKAYDYLKKLIEKYPNDEDLWIILMYITETLNDL